MDPTRHLTADELEETLAQAQAEDAADVPLSATIEKYVNKYAASAYRLHRHQSLAECQKEGRHFLCALIDSMM